MSPININALDENGAVFADTLIESREASCISAVQQFHNRLSEDDSLCEPTAAFLLGMRTGAHLSFMVIAEGCHAGAFSGEDLAEATQQKVTFPAS